MPRKKASNPEDLLTHNLIIRVTETTFNRLDKIRKESKNPSIAEVARKVLSGKQIRLFYYDVSLNPIMEELALIRKELRAIGVNINQITRGFNQDKAGTHQGFYVLKVAEQYQKVDERVERLLTIISQLAEKWLQK